MAVTEDGSLYSWGLNNYGQLGLGGRKSEGLAKVPGLVTIPGGGAAGSRYATHPQPRPLQLTCQPDLPQVPHIIFIDINAPTNTHRAARLSL